ncbi:MAG: biotin/lipoyl-containing protein, partial [Dermatophilaceae bacterium]
MPTQEFRLPDPGEGLTEAEIVEWKVAVGDTVKVNDIVVEIETAKSLVELPVPFAGTVVALLVAEGETVEVGTPIIAVDTGGDEAPVPAPVAEPSTASAAVASELAATAEPTAPQPERTAVLVGYGVKQTEAKRRPRHTVPATTPEEHVVPVASARPGQLVAAHATEVPVATPEPSLRHPAGTPSAKVRAKPPVRKYAKDHGVDLTGIPGTGPDGVITRADVDALLGGGDGAAAVAPAGMPSTAHARGETRTPIKGVRKVTAQAMVGSAFTAPHVTEWVTVDVTRTVELV